MFDPTIWSKLHGASTHFPVALIFVSALCDVGSLFSKEVERRRGFRFAGTVTIVLGALGGYAAVLTGLVITKGQVWGQATLLRHHQFVWPAFALMTGLATWRIFAPVEHSRRAANIYLVLMSVAVALASGAGYWGGELLSEGCISL